jgi:hypothetical protein
MQHSYQSERYARSIINEFVSSQRNLIDTAPLVLDSSQSVELFKQTEKPPEGQIDLLYRFTDDESQGPALGFQQDGVEDDEEMYLLAYIDPRLARSWQNQLDRYRS